MLFENAKDGKVKFLRGRMTGKGNRWNDTVRVGKHEFKPDELYSATDALALTEFGIRVNIDPIQPQRITTIDPASWTAAKIVVPEPKPAKTPATEPATKA